MKSDHKEKSRELNVKMTVLNEESLEKVSGGIMIPAPFCCFQAHCLEPGCGWIGTRMDAQHDWDQAGTVAAVMAQANEHGYATGHFDFEVTQTYPCDL